MTDLKAIDEMCEDKIIDFLNELGLEYKMENDYIAIKCVFHGGDSYNLKYKNGFWYCFSHCNRSFRNIDIVCKVLDLSFKESIDWLCNFVGVDKGKVTVNKNKAKARERLAKFKSMRMEHNIVDYKQVCSDTMNNIKQSYPKYILDRFSDSTLKRFNVGYAFTGELEDRVCFTIDAPNGDIVSISGRSINGALPKYKILDGTNKGETLYNISRVDDSENFVVVVEGFNSVLCLYEWGINNCVATMGANLTEQQKILLLGLGKKIIVIGDNDEAGKNMTQSIYNKCYKYSVVELLDLSEFTDCPKASPYEGDIGFDSMSELVEKIKEIGG